MEFSSREREQEQSKKPFEFDNIFRLSVCEHKERKLSENAVLFMLFKTKFQKYLCIRRVIRDDLHAIPFFIMSIFPLPQFFKSGGANFYGARTTTVPQ